MAAEFLGGGILTALGQPRILRMVRRSICLLQCIVKLSQGVPAISYQEDIPQCVAELAYKVNFGLQMA